MRAGRAQACTHESGNIPPESQESREQAPLSVRSNVFTIPNGSWHLFARQASDPRGTVTRTVSRTGRTGGRRVEITRITHLNVGWCRSNAPRSIPGRRSRDSDKDD